MKKEFLIEGSSVPIWSWSSEESVDMSDYCWQEAFNCSKLPGIYHHLVLTPDFHAGAGMPIGGILALKNLVCPNACGFDIGCGVCAMKTSLKVSDITTEQLRKGIMRGIRRRIPIGKDIHKTRQSEEFMPSSKLLEKTIIAKRKYQSALKMVGTLGNGNHFLELDKDDEGNLWVLIHSGSRNLGAQVGEYYNEEAIKYCNTYATHYSIVSDRLPFLPLDSLPGSFYWAEMKYCIEFGRCNRKLMLERVKDSILDVFPDATFEDPIDTVHNYAAMEEHYGEIVCIHRKGAIKLSEGELGVIPGSQGTSSFIVSGLANPESFNSCSHGAGRKLSRTAAVNTLNLESEIERLDSLGIVHSVRCKSDLEESTGAYKDIDEVMELQKDLVKPILRLYPVAVIKG